MIIDSRIEQIARTDITIDVLLTRYRQGEITYHELLIESIETLSAQKEHDLNEFITLYEKFGIPKNISINAKEKL